MSEAIEVIARAMQAVSAGQAELPLRNVIDVGGGNRMGVMPGALSDPACFGVKLVSLFPGNPARGLSSHRGALLLFEAETGGAVALMDAGPLTAIRTAAASAVATRALARPDAARLTLIGYGEQAGHHLEAICAVRPIERVLVAGRSADRAAAFCARAAARHPRLVFEYGADIRAAVAEADIVCTLTSATAPVLKGDWLAAGAHVNVVGASVPAMREVDAEFVKRASIWVDFMPSALAQAGEIVDLIAAGKFARSDLVGEIGAVLSGRLRARRDPAELTAYRSLGIAAQDLAAAEHILSRARAEGGGQRVNL